MKQLYVALVAGIILAATTSFAATVVIDGDTLHAYGNANLNGTPERSAIQLTFLRAAVVDDSGAVNPFNSSQTADWDRVKKARELEGNFAFDLFEFLEFATTSDTVNDGETTYVVADRDSLTGARYLCVKPIGTLGLSQSTDLPDSLATAIMGGTLTQAAIVARLRLALAAFKDIWAAQPKAIRMTRAEYQKLTTAP